MLLKLLKYELNKTKYMALTICITFFSLALISTLTSSLYQSLLINGSYNATDFIMVVLSTSSHIVINLLIWFKAFSLLQIIIMQCLIIGPIALTLGDSRRCNIITLPIKMTYHLLSKIVVNLIWMTVIIMFYHGILALFASVNSSNMILSDQLTIINQHLSNLNIIDIMTWLSTVIYCTSLLNLFLILANKNYKSSVFLLFMYNTIPLLTVIVGGTFIMLITSIINIEIIYSPFQYSIILIINYLIIAMGLNVIATRYLDKHLDVT